ncbi:MAG TPA: arylesterase [Candidatus Binatia bacterium]|nr:arylesterase [Candidatus Binatia bacterium]
MRSINFRIFIPLKQLGHAAKAVRRIAPALLLSIFLIGAAPQERGVILFLGDSITAGYGLEPSQAYPALIQKNIDAKGWPFRAVNAGQSGDTSAGALERLNWLLKNRVEVLVLELGGNDGLRGLPVENTRKNLQALIDRTREKYPSAKIVIAGMKVPPNMGRTYAEKFETIFVELAKKNRAPLIPFVLEGVGGVPALNLPDGIHPTAKGQEIVAATVWKTLEPVLRSMAK